MPLWQQFSSQKCREDAIHSLIEMSKQKKRRQNASGKLSLNLEDIFPGVPLEIRLQFCQIQSPQHPAMASDFARLSQADRHATRFQQPANATERPNSQAKQVAHKKICLAITNKVQLPQCKALASIQRPMRTSVQSPRVSCTQMRPLYNRAREWWPKSCPLWRSGVW